MPDHDVEAKKGSHVAAFLLICGGNAVRDVGLWMKWLLFIRAGYAVASDEARAYLHENASEVADGLHRFDGFLESR